MKLSVFFVCLLVSVFTVVVVLFDGFKDHLEFQRSFYEFVSSFFVIDSCCKLVSDIFFWCNDVKLAFSLNIHESFPIFFQRFTVFLFVN